MFFIVLILLLCIG
ncbi:hypothetical protein LINPERPRIM_LOCUS22906 [Linum perenne]